LWGNFPGRLQTTLQNSFNFFSVESLGNETNSAVKISLTDQTVVIDQEVTYENFEFDPKKVNYIILMNNYRTMWNSQPNHRTN